MQTQYCTHKEETTIALTISEIITAVDVITEVIISITGITKIMSITKITVITENIIMRPTTITAAVVIIEQWSAAAYLVSIGKCSAHPLLAHV